MIPTPKVIIVSCTRKLKEEANTLPLFRSWKDGLNTPNYKLDISWENTDGLPVVYNRKLQEYKDSGAEFMVCVHDDVYIDDLKLYEKLQTANTKLGYNIIGLAGGLNPRLKDPALWHVMTDRNQQRGEVAHPAGNTNQTMTTPFGPTPSRVAIIDGLFMAVHIDTVAKTNWKFNENYKFHHYDLASSIDANRAQLKIGVYPIHVIHSSPGLLSIHDKGWAKSNQDFLQEYAQ
jgi:hypothetical protein